MNKLKDIIYDKNDLLIALLIVAAAAFIIATRIDIILSYPAALAAEAGSSGNQIVSQGPESADDPAKTESPPAIQSPSADGEEDVSSIDESNGGGQNAAIGEQTTAEPPVTQVSIYIEYGSTGSQIAQLLIDAGLIQEKNEFYDAVAAAGADTKLQAGSFKIPSNATPAQIISIITN